MQKNKVRTTKPNEIIQDLQWSSALEKAQSYWDCDQE